MLRLITAPFRFIRWFFKGIGSGISNVGQSFRSFFSEEPEDTPLADSFSKTIEHPTDILVHLDALRKHLMRAVLALLLATALAFAFSSQLMDFLAQPVEGGLDAMRAIDPTEPLGTVMKVSLLSGFAIALPDVNNLLKGLDGHLFPFGFIKLLTGIPRLRRRSFWRHHHH